MSKVQGLPRIPGNRLTVIIRDDSPMMFCNDSPTYRSVSITLTDEQLKRLSLRYVGQSGADHYYESISKCFIEEPTP